MQNIYLPHGYTSTREEAVADALKAGTDVNCGEYYPLFLPAALEQGLFNESTLDQALVRQYSSLVKLGYFDPVDATPYRFLAWSDVSTPASEYLAYKAAVEGITLLKNDGILPLSIHANTTIALLGDWANATSQMQGMQFFDGSRLRLNYLEIYDMVFDLKPVVIYASNSFFEFLNSLQFFLILPHPLIGTSEGFRHLRKCLL